MVLYRIHSLDRLRLPNRTHHPTDKRLPMDPIMGAFVLLFADLRKVAWVQNNKNIQNKPDDLKIRDLKCHNCHNAVSPNSDEVPMPQRLPWIWERAPRKKNTNKNTLDLRLHISVVHYAWKEVFQLYLFIQPINKSCCFSNISPKQAQNEQSQVAGLTSRLILILATLALLTVQRCTGRLRAAGGTR